MADIRNGFFVDIFSYEEIPENEKEKWMGEKQFLRRIDDYMHYIFPQKVLLPLGKSDFDDGWAYIPSMPLQFLSWEYGQCLGAHVYPWRFFLYTPVPFSLTIIVFLRLIYYGLWCQNFPITISFLHHLCALYFFQQGPLLASYILFGVSDFFIGEKPYFIRYRYIIIFTLIYCLCAFHGIIGQLGCHIWEIFHPIKPGQFFTICIGSYCKDFYL